MDYNTIFKKVEAHVTALFDKNQKEEFVYHNLEHTKSVVDRTKEIAAHYQLIESDMVVLFVSAWFHDTGYLLGEAKNHEEKSVSLMKEFLKEYTTDEDFLKTIGECILATRVITEPANLLQQILKDADTYHIGTKDFKDLNNRVYEEFKLRNEAGSKLEWNRNTILFLKRHKFYTSYCIDQLKGRKIKNLQKLEKRVEKSKGEAEIATSASKSEITENNSFTTKGIQTMLRLTSQNHMKLSELADGKANILISVNAIIISVILTVLLRRLQMDTYLIIPTGIFLSFTVATIIISILATRPKINSGTFSETDILDKKINLLFFGNYYKTSIESYEKAMRIMMLEPDYLYGSLIKDIYQQGVVLARKFKLIRLAYNIFMVGIIISVIAFGLAVMLGTPADGVITNSGGSPF